MWKAWLVVLIAAVAGAIELPGLFRRSAKETAVYGFMLIAGTAMSIAAIQLANWPSPLKVLTYIFAPLHDWLGKVIG